MSEYRQILPKPGFGQSCNGCGLCCAEEPCLFAIELGFADSPCGILEDDGGGRFACGLITNPYQYLPKSRIKYWMVIDGIGQGEGTVYLGKNTLIAYYKTRLAIGCGCDSGSNVGSDVDKNKNE